MDKIKEVKPKQVVPGVTGHYVHGDLHTLGYVILEKGSIVPLHQHQQEQITFVLEGQLDMVIDGKPYSLTPGFYHIIPSNVLHSAVAVKDCVLIDTFSPVREDYKNLDTAAFALAGDTK
jgi:quercetin dioxygenase-like cupin family protein